MTYTPPFTPSEGWPTPPDVTEKQIKTTVMDIHNALKEANIEYSAMSWNGFNLFGDEKSIAEAHRLLHNSDSRLPAIEQLLNATNLGEGRPAYWYDETRREWVTRP